jgi:hypothetical protein
MDKIVEVGFNPKRNENYVIIRNEYEGKISWSLMSGMKSFELTYEGFFGSKRKMVVRNNARISKDERCCISNACNFSYCTSTLKDARKYI